MRIFFAPNLWRGRRTLAGFLLASAHGLQAAGAAAAEPIAAPALPAPPAISSETWSQADHEFTQVVLPFVQENCYKCHGNGKHKGDLKLDAFHEVATLRENPKVWDSVLERIRAGEMPPSDEDQPEPAAKATAVTSIDHLLAALEDPAKAPKHMAVRRLNRVEYVNTVRDLLDLPNFQAGEDFPKDESGYGFDNIANLLTVSPLLFEQYLKTADLAVKQLAATPAAVRRLTEEGFVKETFYNKAEYAHQVLAKLLPRAWRRPVSQAEIERVYKFVALSFAQDGERAKSGLYLALRAILVSPNFLFRIELEGGDADGPTVAQDYRLASRLAYFLWSSMPDDTLFELAAQDTLHQPEVLRAQVRRMLSDPKARALSENFAGQWLLLRNLPQVAPDPRLFPQFDPALRAAMRGETERFFAAIVTEDRSIMDFLDGKFTYVNGPLAKLYGIPGVEGEDFQRVELKGDERSGILTQASVLTVTSNPTRTSPVQRGKWILENILNTPPPPPPDNVPALDDERRQLTGTTRQKLEQHRRDPACASCHAQMDPLGLALENYDAIGAWRSTDGAEAVDSSGTLPDGRTFRGPAQLKEILRTRSSQFRRCLVEKMLIYALGRGLDYHDRRGIDQIDADLARNGDHFSGLILAIAGSDLFQARTAGPDLPPAVNLAPPAPPAVTAIAPPSRLFSKSEPTSP